MHFTFCNVFDDFVEVDLIVPDVFKRLKLWRVPSEAWEETGFAKEKGKERKRIHDRRDTVSDGTLFTVTNISCPCTLQRCIFLLWLSSWPRDQSQSLLVTTVCSWNRVSDVSEGKCSRKWIQEIILKHCLNSTGFPQYHLLSCCTYALQDMTQQLKVHHTAKDSYNLVKNLQGI